MPTRYYIDKTDVRFEPLIGSDTVTSCPYKGTTTAYWSAQVGDTLQEDVAWSYDHPTTALAAITGMVAFYNEVLDVVLDGRPLRPDPSATTPSYASLGGVDAELRRVRPSGATVCVMWATLETWLLVDSPPLSVNLY